MNLSASPGENMLSYMSKGEGLHPYPDRDPDIRGRYIHASFNKEEVAWGYARFLFGGPPSPLAGRYEFQALSALKRILYILNRTFFGMKILGGCFGRLILTGCVTRGGFCVGLDPLPAEDSPGTGARPESTS